MTQVFVILVLIICGAMPARRFARTVVLVTIVPQFTLLETSHLVFLAPKDLIMVILGKLVRSAIVVNKEKMVTMMAYVPIIPIALSVRWVNTLPLEMLTAVTVHSAGLEYLLDLHTPTFPITTRLMLARPVPTVLTRIKLDNRLAFNAASSRRVLIRSMALM
jgi:hypothetical protein